MPLGRATDALAYLPRGLPSPGEKAVRPGLIEPPSPSECTIQAENVDGASMQLALRDHDAPLDVAARIYGM